MIADETDLYSVEDGVKWLSQIFQIKENDWFFSFDFLPKVFKSSKKRKSAIISILLASLNEASTGKLLLTQESHFEKIMVKEKKMNDKDLKNFVESLIFSADEPLSKNDINKILSQYGNFDLDKVLNELVFDYKDRGVVLYSSDNKFYFKTSDSLRDFLSIQTKKTKNLSNAAMETLAIISYHQPVTRAEIEKIRGKPVFRGTLDSLLEIKWIKPAGRRETPGRPVTWVTDIEFLKHFGLKSIKDLPKVDELESIIL